MHTDILVPKPDPNSKSLDLMKMLDDLSIKTIKRIKTREEAKKEHERKQKEHEKWL